MLRAAPFRPAAALHALVLVEFHAQRAGGILDGTSFRDMMAYNVSIACSGSIKFNWTERFLDREKKFKTAESTAESQGFTGRKTGTHPSHALKDYEGEFSHPGSPVLTLAPKHGMTFDIETRPGQSLEFRPDASGKIAEAVLYTPDGVYVIKKK